VNSGKKDPSAEAAFALQRSSGALGTAAMQRMQVELPWFQELSASDRSWVSVVVQAGIRGFISWYRNHPGTVDDKQLAAAVYGSVPRGLTGVINLQQTVDLVRLTLDVVEAGINKIVDPAEAPHVQTAVLRYAREVAFATAQVHARAAETRGAWDARLEALVVDAVLRSEADEAMLSRASALGWHSLSGVAVMVGGLPLAETETNSFAAVRRAARQSGLDALCAAQGDRMVVVLGGVGDEVDAGAILAEHFAEGPLVVGPVTTDLTDASRSARAALAGHRAVSGWPDAPRPVRARELLAERALAGDGQARRFLVTEVYGPLAQSRGTLITTLSEYFAAGSSTEGCARALFVHPNTVRYRIQQVRDLTGLLATDPRDGFTLQIALVLGRLSS
jgi:hypothetical protein